MKYTFVNPILFLVQNNIYTAFSNTNVAVLRGPFLPEHRQDCGPVL